MGYLVPENVNYFYNFVKGIVDYVREKLSIWTISEEEPTSLDGYVKHSLASRTPYALKFDTHDSGKRVWISIAWQNARGVLGDYCKEKNGYRAVK
jgi:hypothetical protein